MALLQTNVWLCKVEQNLTPTCYCASSCLCHVKQKSPARCSVTIFNQKIIQLMCPQNKMLLIDFILVYLMVWPVCLKFRINSPLWYLIVVHTGTYPHPVSHRSTKIHWLGVWLNMPDLVWTVQQRYDTLDISKMCHIPVPSNHLETRLHPHPHRRHPQASIRILDTHPRLEHRGKGFSWRKINSLACMADRQCNFSEDSRCLPLHRTEGHKYTGQLKKKNQYMVINYIIFLV